jgi:hypothetical protein
LDGEEARDVAITVFVTGFLVCAVTINVYDVPFANPETVIGDPVEDPVIEPGVDIATYKLLVPGFPKYKGPVNITLALPLPGEDAVPIIGALGCRPSEDADTPGIIGIMQSNLQ